MKRRELEKKLRHAGCYLKREGGAHSLWINPRTGQRRVAVAVVTDRTCEFPTPDAGDWLLLIQGKP